MDASQLIRCPARTDGSLWSELREALRGTHRDLTEAPLGRAIFVLAVPMVLEMVMESVFAVTDIFFVGRLGAEAQATVGLTETMETMVYASPSGSPSGAPRSSPDAWERRTRSPRHATAVQAIALGLLFGIPLSAPGAFFAPTCSGDGRLAWVLEHGVHFTRVLLGANVSVCLPVPDQRHLPGCGRRGDRHAAPVARQRASTSCSARASFRGSVPSPEDREWPVRPIATSIGRSTGVRLPAVPADPWRRAADGALAARPLEARTMLSVPRALRGRHAPDRRWG
jgi:hypothetical protein